MAQLTDDVQLTIFGSLLAYLRSALELDASRCFEVAKASDLPTIPPGHDWFLTVCWGDSTYVMGEQFVGNITEEPEIILTLYTRLKSDQAGHDQYLLRDSAAGLFALRNQVITAMVSTGLGMTGQSIGGMPRETIKIRHSTSGEVIKNNRDGTFLGTMRVTFAAPYDIEI
jgi:hypothetical protein